MEFDLLWRHQACRDHGQAHCVRRRPGNGGGYRGSHRAQAYRGRTGPVA
jgi:hypothetical protein